jgi:YD repeat-containing protein
LSRHVTSYSYSGNQLVSTVVRDEPGTLISRETETYDLDGNVLTRTDGNVTTNAYLGGRLASTTVGTGTSAAAATSYTYDAGGDNLSETDPDGNVTSYTYDAAGRVLTEATALGTTTSTYDPDGDLLSRTDPTGRKITYRYVGGRVAGQTCYAADGSVTDTRAYTYDLDCNLLPASSDAGGVMWLSLSLAS